MFILGVVPARGGSKGMPRKNLCRVAGRPLLAYTADAARGSRGLSRVIVSTDDEDVAAVARECGLEVPFMRPAYLATDETPMLPVLQHAVRCVSDQGVSVDAVVLLQPTSPLRRADHIDAALDLFERTHADSVVSVIDVPHQFNPVSVMRLEGQRLIPFVEGTPIFRRQDKPRVFARNGPAVLVVRTSILEGGSLYGTDCRPLFMTPEDSIDVDSSSDLDALERMIARSRART